jgi:hypothetical protein
MPVRLRSGGATVAIALLGCGIWLLILDIRGPALPWHALATIAYAMTFIFLVVTGVFELPGGLRLDVWSRLSDADDGCRLLLWERAHAEGGDALAYYMNAARTPDVSTAENEAVFYSGAGNRALAEDFAIANGRTTFDAGMG